MPVEMGCLTGRLVGINSVYRADKPRLFRPGWLERGLVDPSPQGSSYLFHRDEPLIGVVPACLPLFFDADKVSSRDKYVWKGGFEELLGEFSQAGYRFEHLGL